nr:39S ribosomal protein L46, mitochondrial-like [Ipomoea batatas]
MGKGECHIDYTPAPRITEADKTRDRKSQKSLQRALDRNVYILIYGTTVYGRNLVWHFPKKAYELEEFNILPLKCKESRLAMLVCSPTTAALQKSERRRGEKVL